MEILVIAATSFEIQPTIDLLGEKTLVAGIGGVATAQALMRRIGQRRPDLVLQAGVAGCFHPGRIGEVVVVKEEIQADLGVWENNGFRTLFDLGLVGPNEAPYHDGMLPNPHADLIRRTGLPAVRGITVNEITTDQKRIGWYQQNMSPFVESMEGAACHFVCLQENIPFLQLRSVSNDVGERDKTKWNMRGAIAALNKTLIETVNNI